MKVKVTIEKVIFETQIIEVDEKFRACAVPYDELDNVPLNLFEEAANEASRVIGLPLAGEPGADETVGIICAGECVDNGELIFEV